MRQRAGFAIGARIAASRIHSKSITWAKPSMRRIILHAPKPSMSANNESKICVARRLKRGRVRQSRKHGRWERVALRVLGPQRQESVTKGLPENLCLLENPSLIGDAVVAWGRVPGLRKPIQQEIAKKGPEVETNGSVEREFRVDDASIVVRDHHRARMKISVNERLDLVQKFLSEARDGDFERSIAAKVRRDAVELRGV